MSQAAHSPIDAETARLRDSAVAHVLALPEFALHRASTLRDMADSGHAHRAGQALFELGQRYAKSHAGDDRPLYWNRLALRSALVECVSQDALNALEYAARNLPLEPPAEPWVWITGFDPFRFERGVSVGNPSGAAALNLHGQRLQTATGSYLVQSAIFPVRFADFDDDMVERFAERALTGARPASMVMTVSQNDRPGFALERYAGAFRTCAAHDNRGQYGDPAAPHEPRSGTRDLRRTADEPAHLRSGLPISAMLITAHGVPGLHEATEHDATSGTGGRYLSNEIFYRMLRLERATRGSRGHTIPTGHLHVPLLPSPDDLSDEQAFAAQRSATVQGVQTLLLAALSSL